MEWVLTPVQTAETASSHRWTHRSSQPQGTCTVLHGHTASSPMMLRHSCPGCIIWDWLRLTCSCSYLGSRRPDGALHGCWHSGAADGQLDGWPDMTLQKYNGVVSRIWSSRGGTWGGWHNLKKKWGASGSKLSSYACLPCLPNPTEMTAFRYKKEINPWLCWEQQGWLSVPRDFDEFLKDRKETAAYGRVSWRRTSWSLEHTQQSAVLILSPQVPPEMELDPVQYYFDDDLLNIREKIIS